MEVGNGGKVSSSGPSLLCYGSVAAVPCGSGGVEDLEEERDDKEHNEEE